MNDFQKTLLINRFREIAIRELKKAFPDDYPILERDLEGLLCNRSLFEVKVKAQELIAHHRLLNDRTTDSSNL